MTLRDHLLAARRRLEASGIPASEAARDALGGDDFEEIERGGRSLSCEQGLDEARAWLARAS